MKIAIISFDHLDSVLSLSRYIGKNDKFKVDLYLVLSQKYKTASVLNLQNKTLKNGLASTKESKNLIGKQINDYVATYVNCRLFIYNSTSIWDIKNLILTHKFANHLKREKYDIIHFNGTNGVLIYLHLALLNSPRVNTVHDPLPHSGESSWFNTLLFKILFGFNVEFILNSDMLAYLFCDRYKVSKNRVHKIYYGPIEIYRYFKIGPQKRIQHLILFFGRIAQYKGIEYLIEAARIVRKCIPKLKVIIAGNGKYYFNINTICNDNTFKIINRYIPNEELVELIQSSSIIICPYTDATQSGVVMTAYAFNKPVIATNVGGLPEVVEDNVTGKLVPPKDSKYLAEAISNMLAIPQNLDFFSNNIKRKCQSGELSWDYIARQTINVYYKAIKKKLKN